MKKLLLALILTTSANPQSFQGWTHQDWTQQSQPRTTIESRELKDDHLFIVFRRVTPSNAMTAGIPPQPVPDRVEIWREVYGVVGGKLVLVRIDVGKYTPPSEQTVTTPEKIEWPVLAVAK